MGSCASGFGVCCTFVLNSAGGGTVTQNGTILQAPMSQTALADGMNIAYQVNRISSVYVDFGMNPQSMLTFNFGATPGGTTIMRDWDIKVNQIPCTGPTAYSACIRQAADHCCVEFRVCPAPIMNAFTLDSTVGTTETACFTELNPLTPSDIDYIGIAGSSSTCSMTQGIPTRNIYCGTTFNLLATAPNAAVCDCTPPFAVDIVTDNTAGLQTVIPPTPFPRGVCLTYQQLMC
ncbi:hypothetical protein TCAL_03427 [Tigriopus californicus]|uniref:CUB domain-containing protein n=1 Tax=Tigriopus californicus TaxID=6832 RepID=A0A553PTB2_TIGCA|nr:hypothetical protein TCAL_03427 [Tigriopus californicus]